MKTKSRTQKVNSPLENVTTNPTASRSKFTQTAKTDSVFVKDEIKKRETPKKK